MLRDVLAEQARVDFGMSLSHGGQFHIFRSIMFVGQLFFFNKLCFVQFKHRFPSVLVFFFNSAGSWLVFIVD